MRAAQPLCQVPDCRKPRVYTNTAHPYCEMHIVPKHRGGRHEIDNLMVVCSNCHVLFTYGRIQLSSRAGIPRLRQRIQLMIRSAYPYLG
ncbi:MAG: HNH endonuclease [Candidatus Omnitrophica bacterium]|nr:HNH endonuclease [Candidatus Omnitrophota bacterium]